jgi:transcriptional regulator with GAF, ATPase, and Fis domain
MAQDREFREDLYYRLNVFPIYLPPLRERKADIPELVEYFVQQLATSMDKSIESIPQETMRSLVRHHWPGNIRELQNYIARGVILSNDGVFEPAPLESYEQSEPEISNPTLEDKVRREILAACQRANWKLRGSRGAAARLGLTRTTLFYKMKRLGIAHQQTIRRTKSRIQSAPPFPLAFAVLCGEGAITVRDEVYCHGLGSRFRVLPRP